MFNITQRNTKNNIYMKQYKNFRNFFVLFRVVVILFFVLFSVDIAKAAIIEPKIEVKEVKKNEFIVVPIYLDTQFEEINAVEVYVNFPDNLIFRDYLDGKSIITHWIEKPHLQYSDVRRPHIVFSGIVAGGIGGRNLNLVELVFEAKESGIAKIEIDENSKVLLNDGLGTKTKLIALSQGFNILDIKGKPEIKIKDIFPPEPFKIYLARNKEIFNGKYYITFETKDKQSGIAYYEISEKPINFIFLAKPDIKNLSFKKAESPYVLEDQSLRSYVIVKAVDKAGNEKVEILYPQRVLIFDDVLMFIICLVILGGLIIFIIKFRYKNEKLF
ncbi:MAG: hypothetical protein QXD89_00195 [Candidatus Aenigmatarchaeota archaeon]